jgi:hypothetical protein
MKDVESWLKSRSINLDDHLTDEERKAIKRVQRAFENFPRSLSMFGGVPGLVFVKQINGEQYIVDDVRNISVDGGCGDDLIWADGRQGGG